MIAACGEDTECKASFPDLGGLLDQALVTLAGEPIEFPSAHTLTAADFQLLLFGDLYHSANYPHLASRPSTSDVFKPVASDVPVLVLVGRFDPVTPPRYAALAAAELGRAQVVEFNATGHNVGRSTTCALAASLKFLQNPNADLDLGCATDTIAFTRSAPERLR